MICKTELSNSHQWPTTVFVCDMLMHAWPGPDIKTRQEHDSAALTLSEQVFSTRVKPENVWHQKCQKLHQKKKSPMLESGNMLHLAQFDKYHLRFISMNLGSWSIMRNEQIILFYSLPIDQIDCWLLLNILILVNHCWMGWVVHSLCLTA